MSHDPLHDGPDDRGQLIGWDGGAVSYSLRLLSERRLDELTAEVEALDADVRKSELTLRVCTEAVRHPDTGAALASQDGWRCMPRTVIAQCATHYVRLAATERPTGLQLERILTELERRVDEMREQPAGALEDWRVMFAQELAAYFGKPAQQLSLVQVAYFGEYWAKLAEEAKERRGK